MPRTLPEAEFNALKAKVLGSLPPGLSEDEFKRVVGPRFEQALGEAENQPPAVEGSALARGAKGVASVLNPITAVEGLWNAAPIPQALHGSGVIEGPLGAVKAQWQAIQDQYQKAHDMASQGRYVEALGHAGGMIPLIGPAAAHAGEEGARGNVAGMVGEGAGLLAPALVPVAVGAARQTAAQVGKTAAGEAVASAAESGASRRFAQTMAPTGSSQEIRTLGKQAQAIAPEVRQGTTAITPEGLHGQVMDRLDAAGESLDTAYQKLPNNAWNVNYSTRPVLDRLKDAKAKLVRSGAQGGVISDTNIPRVAAIDKAIGEIDALGPYASTEQLAKLRNDWKTAAKDAFVPSVNPNASTLRASGSGWADSWSALQDALVARHPELRPLNADYHVWKQASDVMQAAADRELVRPTVGRTMLARGLGAAAGGAEGGGTGAVVGAVVGPLLERGIAETVAPAVKLAIARKLGDLADALRSGSSPGQTISAFQSLKALIRNTQSSRKASYVIGGNVISPQTQEQ